MKHYLALAALPLIAACAQNPDSIAPVSMGDAYAGISCNQARGAIVVTYLLLQAAGDLAQQFITLRMPQGVVDFLEMDSNETIKQAAMAGLGVAFGVNSV